MKRLISYRTLRLILVVAMLSMASDARAQADAPFIADMEARLLERINGARQNPLQAAAAAGLSADQVLTDIPALKDVLEGGMAPLQPVQALVDAARVHTRNMLAGNYYGYQDPDGTTLDERLRQRGYYARTTGESLSLVGFFNFIDPQRAVGQIFDTLLKRELDIARTGPQTLLNPEFEDIGIGFDSGKLTLNGVTYNVYLVTCYFGVPLNFEKSETKTMARQLASLINQFRADPMTVINTLEIDITEALAESPGLDTYLYTSFPPLVPSAALELVLGDLPIDPILDDQVSDDPSPVDPDGDALPPTATMEERLAAAGYVPLYIRQVAGIVTFESFRGAAEAVHSLFRQLVSNEIEGYRHHGEFVLLNDHPKDIGIGILQGTVDIEGLRVETLLATVVLATPDPSEINYVVGAVYVDENGDGLHSLGEGVSGILITFEPAAGGHDEILVQDLLTNNVGSFAWPMVEPGPYHVTLHVPEQGPVVYLVQPGEGNVFLDHRLGP